MQIIKSRLPAAENLLWMLHVVAIGLRCLAGGSYIDIASLYRCCDLFIDAVLNYEELKKKQIYQIGLQL